MRVTLPTWRQLFARKLRDLYASQRTCCDALNLFWPARFVTRLSRSVYFSTSLASWFTLIWAAERIQFKLAALTLRCLNDTVGTALRFTVSFFSSLRWRSFPSMPTLFFHQRSECSSDSDYFLSATVRSSCNCQCFEQTSRRCTLWIMLLYTCI